MNQIISAIVTIFKKYTNKISSEDMKQIEQVISTKKIGKNEIIHLLDENDKCIYFICSRLIRSYYIDNHGKILHNFHERK